MKLPKVKVVQHESLKKARDFKVVRVAPHWVWIKVAVLLFVLLLAGPLHAQIGDDVKPLTVFPTEGKAVGYVEADQPGKWVVLGDGFLPVQFRALEGGKCIIFEADPGAYGVLFFPPGDTTQPKVTRVVLSADKPDPPTPDPEPGPGPAPTPGTRWLLIIHEAQDTTFAQEQLFAQLRRATELSKHKLKIVDDDATDEDGGTVDALDPWIRRAAGKPQPYLFILDNDGKVLFEGACPADKAAFLKLVKAKGG